MKKIFYDEVIWPKFLLLVIISAFSFCQCAWGEEGTNSGRPLSAFGICCCKKDSETEKQIFYSCHFTEDRFCSEGTQKYDVAGVDCPSSLIHRRYLKEGD